jgi:hypothetical protein
MGKEHRCCSAQPIKPISRSFGFATQPLEFSARPANEIVIDPLEGRTQFSPIKVAEVIEPAADLRVCNLGQFIKGYVAAYMKSPALYFSTDRLQRTGTDGWLEAVREDTLLAFPPHRLPGSKLEAEKIECDDGKVVGPSDILAVDDLRLLRMQFQLAIGKTIDERTPEGPGLCLGSAVTYNIVGLAFERDVRIVPRHPRIKRIVQKQVRQERTDNAALWCACLPAARQCGHLPSAQAPSTSGRCRAAPMGNPYGGGRP